MYEECMYEVEVSLSGSGEAIKFANRASPIHQDSKIQFPIFPIGGEIRKKQKKVFS